jgi:hypothetical protein
MSKRKKNAGVEELPSYMTTWTGKLPQYNGEDIQYNTYSLGGKYAQSPKWYSVDYATGSDYSGNLIQRSNYNVLKKMLEKEHPDDPANAVVWASTYGGHGTYGLLVKWEDLGSDIQEAIGALDEYPLLDEMAHSELEMESQNEAWERWVEKDFKKALAVELGIEDKDKITGDIFELFREAQDDANEYWINEQGDESYIDIEPIVEKAAIIVKADPEAYGLKKKKPKKGKNPPVPPQPNPKKSPLKSRLLR